MPTPPRISARTSPGTNVFVYLAYAASGLASLIYQVSWTRLLTLHMGHSIAAASTVVGAFMGGLAAGAFVAGRVAPRLSPRRALASYIALEGVVAVLAPVISVELRLMTPVLSWAYSDGASPLLFPIVRLLLCLLIVFVPALALGATFPLAVRSLTGGAADTGRSAGSLYAVNTVGAALGAVLAGFVLIPRLGVSATIWMGVLGSVLAVTAGLVAWRATPADVLTVEAPPPSVRPRHRPESDAKNAPLAPQWLPLVVLGLTGFAALTYEIVWTRVVAMLVGPTTYAFSGTVAAMIAGLAIGSAVGSRVVAWTRRPQGALAFSLAATAASIAASAAFGGSYVPRIVAAAFLSGSPAGAGLLMQQTAAVSALVLPAAIGFGASFPLTLGLLAGPASTVVARLGVLYGVNTLMGVVGSLAAGFLVVPLLGLQRTLGLAAASTVVAAVVVAYHGRTTMTRVIGGGAAAAAILMATMAPSWDRDLLSSGAYKYASQIPIGLDLDVALRAGRLLYYEEGAAATVSVRKRSGALSLAIDGKVDASNVGDMLTQKTLAHLPLLLHPDPHDVYIIGLGSGITLGAALTHPVRRVDVAELSPEVVEASRYFAADNRDALADPRTHLIVGDGRTHLSLTPRQYDVIISEPSNPWMAGVAALFTKEAFEAARERLAPGGIICQWAHTYDISDQNLRSIVATFASVFPDGTMWLVGEGDLLLIASTGPVGPLLGNIEASWRRTGVTADLARVSAMEPFAFWSLFNGAGDALQRYAAGAVLLTDDRMSLEFSGPWALGSGAGIDNVAALRKAHELSQRPPVIANALKHAGASQWRDRGAMLGPADGYRSAFGDYVKAATLDPTDAVALAGLARAAANTGRQPEAYTLITSLSESHPQSVAPLVALSKLLAAGGAFDRAIETATRATRIQPVDARALEQLASLYADLGDAPRLAAAVSALEQLAPERASVPYYKAAVRFLEGQHEAAAQLARAAVERAPEYAPAHNLLGAIYASMGRRDDARQALTTGLQHDPSDGAAYANLGLLELEAADPVAASAYFAEALTIDPQSEMARRGLAEARRRRSD